MQIVEVGHIVHAATALNTDTAKVAPVACTAAMALVMPGLPGVWWSGGLVVWWSGGRRQRR